MNDGSRLHRPIALAISVSVHGALMAALWWAPRVGLEEPVPFAIARGGTTSAGMRSPRARAQGPFSRGALVADPLSELSSGQNIERASRIETPLHPPPIDIRKTSDQPRESKATPIEASDIPPPVDLSSRNSPRSELAAEEPRPRPSPRIIARSSLPEAIAASLDASSPESPSTRSLPGANDIHAATAVVRKAADDSPSEQAPTPIELAASPAPADLTIEQSSPRAEPTAAAAPAPGEGSARLARSERTTQSVSSGNVVAAPGMGGVSGAKVDRQPRKMAWNTPPRYPADALAANIQGRVMLRVLVGADGRVSRLSVERSSGSTSLDDAALIAVRRWRFEPARRFGRAVDFEVLVPVKFSIVRS